MLTFDSLYSELSNEVDRPGYVKKDTKDKCKLLEEVHAQLNEEWVRYTSTLIDLVIRRYFIVNRLEYCGCEESGGMLVYDMSTLPLKLQQMICTLIDRYTN